MARYEPHFIEARRRPLAITGALAVFVAGLIGAFSYIDNFRLYRGYPAPRDPAFVRSRGKLQTIYVSSPLLGGRRQRVLVYLPPGYVNSQRRYPVMYLLHGSPGTPEQFLNIVRAGILVDELVARRAPPLILVMPFGATGVFGDTEWLNGVRPHSSWETFVAQDVVRAIDDRYRTVPHGRGRAIAGLSEGGYGAINIALHHPGEFRVVESWSGYVRAAPNRRLFGRDAARIRYNSPLFRLPFVAAALRRAQTFFWFYSGRSDPYRAENAAFAASLAGAHIGHHFFTVAGRHDWRLWRNNAAASIAVAETHLAGR
jgi:enterochelin esterase-like enzyme